MKKLLIFLALLPAVMQAEEVARDTVYVDVCLDSTRVLSSAYDDHEYLWLPDSLYSQTFTYHAVEERTDTFTCYVYLPEHLISQNLMSNGDFENYTDYRTAPTGFTSDYEYLPFDPKGTNLYDDPRFQGKSGVYLLSENAQHTWRDYANVSAHSGKLFAMFDAARSGYAWKARTTENPGLELIGGKRYVFSYWAADLNQPNQRDHPAELQFSINYRDADGTMKKEYLGSVLKLGQDNEWHYSKTYWTAPVSSDYIEIGVEDLNTYYGAGNDFGLDDIIFQLVEVEDSRKVAEQIFIVNAQNCSCEDLVYAKWDDVLFVSNVDSLFTAYQWLLDGQPIEGATKQFLYMQGNVQSGYYSALVTDINGDQFETCAHTFADMQRSAEKNSKQPVRNASKRFINGHLFIDYRGTLYNTIGQRVIKW